ncbi:unnamed protein product [Toxocara canis]|uniref:Uncharacterized protein n=1 Tax=Toxocara canis TaxID=6265 RepID=A0A183V814_TOXCA|nr:unnamed protein product [Toxocara canis]
MRRSLVPQAECICTDTPSVKSGGTLARPGVLSKPRPTDARDAKFGCTHNVAAEDGGNRKPITMHNVYPSQPSLLSGERRLYGNEVNQLSHIDERGEEN